ncbi:putative L,D-transpeptidase ErfK/SrfK precursor [Sulfitobacter sp. THAF37]|uniref:L,D-transpeptidase n=1 Tax=Sulfitobacter sp. THAF37 TaxID=2587855 RepID=UPI001267F368|nr:L,D-transpeptidase [Sulfitobacter sp. THAF37]QFT57701.1 putative L,D-transpeptidase ErfK/SrfK precursor [Sulfitobacter sp. THAF37]
MMNRRTFLAAGGAVALGACARQLPQAPTAPAPVPAPPPPMPAFYDAVPGEPFPVPAIPAGSIDPALWRQEVANPWPDRPRGTIVVDPDAAMLHFVETSDTATRYGVSVGAEGFAWNGTARLQFQREWPRWKVPETMIARKPELAPYSVANGGMDPGPGNPLGARALYLFQDGIDTLYRIHGDASPRELGKAVSSGCIRMLNQDVIHLFDRSVHGAAVIVLPSMKPERTTALY